jgi:hypothetical protein
MKTRSILLAVKFRYRHHVHLLMYYLDENFRNQHRWIPLYCCPYYADSNGWMKIISPFCNNLGQRFALRLNQMKNQFDQLTTIGLMFSSVVTRMLTCLNHLYYSTRAVKTSLYLDAVRLKLLWRCSVHKISVQYNLTDDLRTSQHHLDKGTTCQAHNILVYHCGFRLLNVWCFAQ